MVFGEGYPVYHSMYDDFVLMKNYGDALFQRHVAVASIWGLETLRLADEEFVPFNYLSYAYELQEYAEDLRDVIRDREMGLTPLFRAIKEFEKAANKIKHQIKALKESQSWLPMWKRSFSNVRELNDRLIMAERAFTDDDGVFGRSWRVARAIRHASLVLKGEHT